MKQLASEEERVFLDAYDDPQAFETDELAEKLLAWSQSVLLMQA